MLVPFSSLPDTSRIWIYQSDKKFNDSERAIISDHLSTFIDQWRVHGEPLKASFQLMHDYFIVVGVDEAWRATSGCSIDASVNAVKHLSAKVSIDFFNRTNIAFVQNGSVSIIPNSQLKAALEDGRWNAESMTFNNLIATKAELATAWVVPAASTWLVRYLPKTVVS